MAAYDISRYRRERIDAFHRIKDVLKVCAQLRLMENLNHDYAYAYVEPRDASELADHSYYGTLNPMPDFYTFYIGHDPARPEKTVPVVVDTKDWLRKAVMVYNDCRDSCYVLWDLVHNLLKWDRDVLKIEWCRAKIRPRIVLFDSRDIGREKRYKHDFLRIYTRTGLDLVLDVTGWQFGFCTWLFTWQEYESSYIDKPHSVEVMDPTKEQDCYLLEAASDRETEKLYNLRNSLKQLDVEGLLDLKETYKHVDVEGKKSPWSWT